MNSMHTSRPTKVLYCIDRLIRGGTELQLIGLIERLDREQYIPYLLTIRPTDPALVPCNCTWLSWDLPRLGSLAGLLSILRLKKWLKTEKVSIVHTYFQDATVVGGVASYIAGVPVRIASFRDLGFWITPFQKLYLRHIYSLMTNFVCNAEVIRQSFVNHFHLRTSNITVLRNGIDSNSLSFIEHTGKTKHIGIVGNMTRRVKRIDLFIEAAAIVAKDYPDICWHVIGDGYLLEELRNHANSIGLQNRIHFAGSIADVTRYMEQLDIGVICSDSEGLSNVLLEYMSKGTAAIATAVGGNLELIEDEVTGILVPPNSASNLAEAIVRLIKNPSLRQKLAKTARSRVESDYSWENSVANHIELYKQCIDNR